MPPFLSCQSGFPLPELPFNSEISRRSRRVPPINTSRVHKAPLSQLQTPPRSSPQAHSSPRLLTTSLLSDISTAPPPLAFETQHTPSSRHHPHQPNLPPTTTLNTTTQHQASQLAAILTPTHLPTNYQPSHQPPHQPSSWPSRNSKSSSTTAARSAARRSTSARTTTARRARRAPAARTEGGGAGTHTAHSLCSSEEGQPASRPSKPASCLRAAAPIGLAACNTARQPARQAISTQHGMCVQGQDLCRSTPFHRTPSTHTLAHSLACLLLACSLVRASLHTLAPSPFPPTHLPTFASACAEGRGEVGELAAGLVQRFPRFTVMDG